MKEAITKAIAVVMLFFCGTTVSQAVEKDKVLHFSISAVFGAISESYVRRHLDVGYQERILLSTALATAPGLLKEFYDDTRENNKFSRGDMVANVSGAFVGALLNSYYNNSVAIGYDEQYGGVNVSYRARF